MTRTVPLIVTKTPAAFSLAPLFWFSLPEAPIGEVAGVVMLWVLSPRVWEGADGMGCGWAPEGPARGPGGFSLCGDVRGVLRGVLG